MSITVEKIPGGFSVDGLNLKNGKCGCTTVLPCCYSWSKVKRSGNTFTFIVKATGPDTQEHFRWSYTVRKEDAVAEVSVDDAADKEIFSGFYPPKIEEWLAKGWELVNSEGDRRDFGLWRCAACRWLYKEQASGREFEDLPEDWKCPVCRTGKGSFERVG